MAILVSDSIIQRNVSQFNETKLQRVFGNGILYFTDNFFQQVFRAKLLFFGYLINFMEPELKLKNLNSSFCIMYKCGRYKYLNVSGI